MPNLECALSVDDFLYLRIFKIVHIQDLLQKLKIYAVEWSKRMLNETVGCFHFFPKTLNLVDFLEPKNIVRNYKLENILKYKILLFGNQKYEIIKLKYSEIIDLSRFFFFLGEIQFSLFLIWHRFSIKLYGEAGLVYLGYNFFTKHAQCLVKISLYIFGVRIVRYKKEQK